MKPFINFVIVHLCLYGISYSQEIGCFVDGECTFSPFVEQWAAEDAQECLEICRDYEGCNFFTHYGENDDDLCVGFGDCVELSTSGCTECYTGNANCPDLQCWVPGSCEGGIVSVEVVEREGDCLQMCKDVDGCDWFTFDDSDGACILLTACTQIDDDTCNTCWSGQRQCGERKDFTKIMVIGGFSDDLASELDDVEILNLDSESSGCDGIAAYPMPTDSMVGVVMDGYPFLCGGFVPEIGDGTDECYTYNYQSLAWESSRSKMTMPRYYHRASLVDSATWLITGGRDAAGVYFDSTEIFQDGVFTQGPTLPSERDCHCQVTLNSSYVAILGGYNGVEYDQTFYLLDWAIQGYESMPDAPFQFCNDGCGLIDNSENGQELVFFNENACQIFNFGSNSWREGPAIPSDVTYESMTVQMLKDFFVMGGRRPDDSSTDSVYRFDAENYQWIREGVTLQTPRRKGVGLAVPDNVVNCS